MDISNTAGLWDAVKPLLEKYRSLKLSENIDYDKFYLYSLIAHSTAVEGSTLTEEETRLLLDEGLTANGKPLAHHLMNTDLRDAYVLARDKARSKEAVTIDLLREFNAAVMKSTGGPISAMAGSFDSSKGEFRLLNVTAGFKGRSYTAYQKVPAMTARFCEDLQNELSRGGQDARQLYELSFKAHLNLVTIHPWRDGNGRTARLLMNYIQFCYSLVLVKVYSQDRAGYIKSLEAAQINHDAAPFMSFMAGELLKNLREEIGYWEAAREKEDGLF